MVARCQRGFTLLEVLVALTIVAIAMGALIKVAGEQAVNAAYLRDRTLAHWVGMNVVAEYQLAEQWPETGRSQGEQVMAQRDWYWRAQISETPDEAVRRLDLTVHAEEGSAAPVLATLAAFLPQPVLEAGP